MEPTTYVVFYTSCDTFTSKVRYMHRVEMQSVKPPTSREALRQLRELGIYRPKVSSIHKAV